MTENNPISTLPIHRASAGKRMWQGGGIALVLISLFLFSVGEPDPNWPRLWMLKPLIMVPAAGALGGVWYYFLDHLRYRGGWREVAAFILSLAGYFIILWLGTVLGLNGTMWD